MLALALRNTVALVAPSLAALAAAATANAQTFTTIVDPVNPTFTQALGINNAGTVVGYGNATTFNGFELTLPSTFTRQNVPGADGGTQVVGISGAGTTVGFSITGGVTSGFAHTGNTFTPVNQPGTAFNQLLGINQAGTVAAGYSSTDPTGMTLQKAQTVSGGPSFTSPTFTDINALLPANFNSQATGVNNAGTVVGFYQLNMAMVPDFSAFVDKGGVITTFLVPGSVSTQALGINDLGDVVGDYVLPNGNMFGFLDVNGMFTTLDPFNSTAVTANGINDNGQIVGFFVDANGNTIGFISSTVPEPSTWAMMLIGFAGLGFAFRQSRRKVWFA
jgi:hypothetical protein